MSYFGIVNAVSLENKLLPISNSRLLDDKFIHYGFQYES